MVCSFAQASLTVAVARGEEQVVATVPRAKGLTAFGGHVVWSQRDEAIHRWRLMQWHAGVVTRLPIPPRAVAFDADAGPDVQGRAAVVYSRCRVDPTSAVWKSARGCRVWEVGLDGGRERRVRHLHARGFSEATPSIWGTAIAFQRFRDGARRSVLRISRHRRDRALGLPTPKDPGPVYTSALDLGPRVAAAVFQLDTAGGQGAVWELWLKARRGGKRVAVAAGEVGECAFGQVLSPNAYGTGVLWVALADVCADALTPGGVHEGKIRKFDWRRHVAAQAGTRDYALEAARDGPTTWWLHATGTGGPGRLDSDNPIVCARSPQPCELMRSTPLVFTPFPFTPPFLPT
jgi:hypothetical protein